MADTSRGLRRPPTPELWIIARRRGGLSPDEAHTLARLLERVPITAERPDDVTDIDLLIRLSPD